MAKSKEVELPETTGVVEAESAEEREFDSVMGELGGSAVRWNVYCIFPRDKAGHCATWESGTEISLDRIAREFGAGEYKVRAFGSDGRVIGGKNVKISSNTQYEREKAKALLPQVAKPEMSMMEIIALMDRSQSNMLQIMMANQKAQSDLLMALLMKPQPLPASNGLDAPAVINMMASMKGMLSSGDGGGVDTLLKGLELGRSLDGPADGGTDFMSLAAKGLDVVGSALKHKNENPRPPPPMRKVAIKQQPKAQIEKPEQTQPTAAKVESEVKAEIPQTAEQTTMFKQLQWLKLQVNALLVQAKRDSDPALYAAVFLDNLPDFVSEEEIEERFKGADALTQLALVNSQVSQHSQWFDQFRLAVLEQLSETDAEELDGMDVTDGAEEIDGID